MKKWIMLLALFVLLAAAPARALDVFPDLELAGDLTPEQAARLGIEGAPVKVSAIPADYLLIEVFSLYCPICQREAPAVNDMRRDILAGDKADRIRFIGLGAGNTPFEVNYFAKKYAVEFPLFHDQEFVGHKALNSVGTPAFYLVDLRDGLKILYFHEGSVADTAPMVRAVLDAVK